MRVVGVATRCAQSFASRAGVGKLRNDQAANRAYLPTLAVFCVATERLCSILHAVLCQSKTKQGKPCARQALDGKELCGIHDPETLRARASAGGKARSTRYAAARTELTATPLETVADIKVLIAKAICLVESSKAENCTRARVLLAAAQAALSAIETGTLEQELRELRALVEERLGTVRAA